MHSKIGWQEYILSVRSRIVWYDCSPLLLAQTRNRLKGYIELPDFVVPLSPSSGRLELPDSMRLPTHEGTSTQQRKTLDGMKEQRSCCLLLLLRCMYYDTFCFLFRFVCVLVLLLDDNQRIPEEEDDELDEFYRYYRSTTLLNFNTNRPPTLPSTNVTVFVCRFWFRVTKEEIRLAIGNKSVDTVDPLKRLFGSLATRDQQERRGVIVFGEVRKRRVYCCS